MEQCEVALKAGQNNDFENGDKQYFPCQHNDR